MTAQPARRSEPFRVAIDTRPLQAPWGGIRRYTSELLRALPLVDPGTEYVPVGPTLVDPGAAEEMGSGAFHGLRSRLAGRFRLPSRTRPVHLFHGTNYFAPLFEFVPLVLTVHDLTVQLFPKLHPPRRRLLHRVLPLLCRRARRLIVDSRTTASDLMRLWEVEAAKIEVVYLASAPGLDPPGDPERIARVRARYGLPERFLLFLGSLEPRKELGVLLDALALLRAERPCPALVIAGTGAPRYLSQLRDRARQQGLRVGEHVLFLGSVAEEDLAVLYSLCEVFAYPSRYEGFGLPPLEAMACGAPVVLPPTRIFRELYSEAAFLADGDDAAALARAIRAVLDDRCLRQELRERGLKHAAARSWTDVARETLAVYREAA